MYDTNNNNEEEEEDDANHSITQNAFMEVDASVSQSLSLDRSISSFFTFIHYYYYYYYYYY